MSSIDLQPTHHSRTTWGLSPELGRACRQWRGRWRRRVAVVTVLGGLGGFLSLALVALVGEFAGFRQEAGYPLWSLGLLAVAGLTACLLVYRLWLRPISLRNLAEAAERRWSAARGQIMAALELPALAEQSSVDSLALREEMQRRVGTLIEQLPAQELFPLRGPVLRFFVAGLGIVSLAHIGLAVWPGFEYSSRVRGLLTPSSAPELRAWTFVEFEPEWVSLPLGEDFEIDVTVSGRDVESCSFHWTAQAGESTSAEVPVFEAPQGGPALGEHSGVIELKPQAEATARATANSGTKPSSRRVFRLTLQRVTASIQGEFHGGTARSKTLAIRVAPRPRVLEYEKTYRAPSYLGGDITHTQREAHGDLEALEGSSAQLVLHCDTELERASLLISLEGEREREVPLECVGKTAVLESLPLEKPGTYRSRIVAAGTSFENAWPPTQAIRLEIDQAPKIEVFEPPETSLVARDEIVQVRLRVRDQVGLAELTERITPQGGESSVRVVKLFSGEREAFELTRLNLGDLAADSGDIFEVTYGVRDLRGKTVEAPARILIVGGLEEEAESETLAAELSNWWRQLSELTGRLRRMTTRWAAFEKDLSRMESGSNSATQPLRNGRSLLRDAFELVQSVEGLHRAAHALVDQTRDPTWLRDLTLIRDVLATALDRELWNSVRNLEAQLEAFDGEGQTTQIFGAFGDYSASHRVKLASANWQRALVRLTAATEHGAVLLLAFGLERGIDRGLFPLAERLTQRLEQGAEELERPEGATSQNSGDRALGLSSLTREALADVAFLEEISSLELPKAVEASVRDLMRFVERLKVILTTESGTPPNVQAVLLTELDRLKQEQAHFVATSMGRRREARAELLVHVETLGDRLKRWGDLLQKTERDLQIALGVDRRELEGMVGDSPGDLRLQGLRGVFGVQSSRAQVADFLSDGTPLLDGLQRDILRRQAWVETDALADGRHAGDLASLDRALLAQWGHVEAAVQIFPPPEINRLWKGNDRVGLKALLETWREEIQSREDIFQGVWLTRVGDLTAKLELSASLRESSRVFSSVLRREKARAPQIKEIAQARHRKFEECREVLNTLRIRSRDLGVDDLALEIERIVHSLEFEKVSEILSLRDRGPERLQISDKEQLVGLLSEIDQRLEGLDERQTPMLLAAREALRDLAPGMAEEIEAALVLAREAESRSRSRLDGNRNESLAGMLDSERLAAGAVRGLRELFGRQAASLDLTLADSVRRARDYDIAIAALTEPLPRAEDYLLAIMASKEEGARVALENALGIQDARVQHLERLLAHFRELEESPEPNPSADLSDLERKLNLEEKHRSRYEEIEALGGLRDRQMELRDQTREVSDKKNEVKRAELQRLGAEQESLHSDLAKRVRASQSAVRALAQQLETILRKADQDLAKISRTQAELNERREQNIVGDRLIRLDLFRRLGLWLTLAQADRNDSIARVLHGLKSMRPSEISKIEIWDEKFGEELDQLERLLETVSPSGTLEVIENWLPPAEARLESGKHLFEEEFFIQDVISKDLESAATSPIAKTSLELRDLLARLGMIETLRNTRRERREQEDSENREREGKLRQERLETVQRRSEETDVGTLARLVARSRQLDRELDDLRLEIENLRRDRATEDRDIEKALEKIARRSKLAARVRIQDQSGLMDRVLDEFIRAASYLETRDVSRAQRRLALGVESLDGARSEGLQSEIVEALVEARMRIMDRRAELLALRRELNSAVENSTQSRNEISMAQQELSNRSASLARTLSRAKRDAEVIEDSRASQLGRVSTVLSGEGMRAMQEVLEADHTLNPIVARQAGQRALAAVDSARELLAELNGQKAEGASSQGATQSGNRQQSSSKAGSLAGALDAMGGAIDSLQAAEGSEAEVSQERAAKSLAKAIRAAKNAIDQQRRNEAKGQGESGGQAGPGESSPSNEPGSENSSNPGDGGAMSNIEEPGQGIDRELLEALMRGDLGDGSWARLPSELRRQLLQGHRETISPEYRALVEAYFRALVEVSRREDPAVR